MEYYSHNRLTILTSLLTTMIAMLFLQMVNHVTPSLASTLTASIQQSRDLLLPTITDVDPNTVELWRKNTITINGKNLSNEDVVVFSLNNSLSLVDYDPMSKFVSRDFRLDSVNKEKNQGKIIIPEEYFNSLINKTLYVWLKYVDNYAVVHSVRLPERITFSSIPTPKVTNLTADTDRIFVRREVTITVSGTNFINSKTTIVKLYNAQDFSVAELTADNISKDGTSLTFSLIPTKIMANQGPIQVKVFNLPGGTPAKGGGLSDSLATFTVYKW